MSHQIIEKLELIQTLCYQKFKKDEQTADIQVESNLLKAQQKVHLHPSNVHLINLECKMTDILKKAKEERDSALQQKGKIAWLTMGHENRKFFHQSIKHIHNLNTINVLHMGNNIIRDQTRIKEIFQEYYMDLLRRDINDRRLIKTFFHYLSLRRRSRGLPGASLRIKPSASMVSTVAFTRHLGQW